MISNLIQSYDVYEDLLAKSNNGTEFYRKLEGNVLRLMDRVRGLCKLQQEERQHLRERNPKVASVNPGGSTLQLTFNICLPSSREII